MYLPAFRAIWESFFLFAAFIVDTMQANFEATEHVWAQAFGVSLGVGKGQVSRCSLETAVSFHVKQVSSTFNQWSVFAYDKMVSCAQDSRARQVTHLQVSPLRVGSWRFRSLQSLPGDCVVVRTAAWDTQKLHRF